MQATNRPIDATPAWRIRRGAVDLFLAREDGGARRLLGRVSEGGAVMSPPLEGGYRLVLEPAPGAELEDAAPEELSPAELDAWRAVSALAERTRAEESRFGERARERERQDRANLREAYRALAGVLDSDSGPAALPVTGDPLLRAARAVCAAAGIERDLKPAARGATLLDPIESLARVNRLRVRRVSLTGDWWHKDAGPMFAYDSARQPLALLPRGGHYVCWNPATGATPRVDRRVAEQLAGAAFLFYRPFPTARIEIADLLAFAARGMGRDTGAVALTGALAGLIGMAVPVATGLLFDAVIPASDRGQLAQMFAILIAAAIATSLLNLARDLALLRIESRADASLQAALWDRLLSLPAAFFRGYSAGDLAQRSLAISNMRQTLTGGAVPAILGGLFSIFGLALMFQYGGTTLALPGIALVALSFAITAGAGIWQVRLQRELAAASGQVAGLLPQLLAGVTKLRIANAEHRAFARWALGFAREKRIAARARRLASGLKIFFPAFQTACMMILFRMLASSDGISAGSFLAFQSAFLQVLMGATQTGSALVAILAIVPQYERARPILETAPEVAGGKSDPGELKGAIELAHVAFRYRADLPAVLRDVSFRVNPGEFAAIVGASGSGKSTVFRLLLGFEKPESGSLFFDGQDIADLDIDLVRRQIGAVLQQGRVLAGSIFQNIAGAAPLSPDDAWEAARLAGLDQDLRNMPMGIHTLVAEGGMGLSGGQIQRLQIARALARRPRVILFDEATSALDNRTQAVVMESLARLKVTRIVVAHRLTTIRGADRIFVMDRGAVAESGTYDELMDRDGLFARLARRQLS